MSFGEWALAISGGLFLLYIAARLIFTAYFLSNAQHEQRKKEQNHGRL